MFPLPNESRIISFLPVFATNCSTQVTTFWWQERGFGVDLPNLLRGRPGRQSPWQHSKPAAIAPLPSRQPHGPPALPAPLKNRIIFESVRNEILVAELHNISEVRSRFSTCSQRLSLTWTRRWGA